MMAMRAAVFHGPEHVVVEEVAVPEPCSGEIVIRVGANTVCGTDTRIFRGEKTKGVRRPSILGHEFAGEVAEVGADVVGFEPGDRVAMAPVIACRACPACIADRENACDRRQAMGYEFDGGLAEFVRIPAVAVAAGNVFRVDSEIPYEHLALAEPLSCCVNGFRRSGITLGDRVVLLGAGPIGQLHTQLARVAGASEIVVSEPSAFRREMALSHGATRVVDPTQEDLQHVVHDATDGQGADAVVVCIGVPTLVDEAISLARKGGSLNLFAGFPKGARATVDPNEIHYRELVVTGTTAARRRDYQESLRLILSGSVQLDAMVTECIDLDGVADLLAAPPSDTGLKVAVTP
jgi:L-iditol 2-dehydrogenase